MRRLWWTGLLSVSILGMGAHAKAEEGSAVGRVVRVCVEIQMKSWEREAETPDSAVKPAAAKPRAPAAAPAPKPAEELPASPAEAPSEAQPPAPPAPKPEGLLRRKPGDRVLAWRGPWLASPYANEPFGANDLERAVAPAATTPPLASTTVTEEGEGDTFMVRPDMYLRRLVEHYVTHDPGFEAVGSGCSQTLTVELYPIHVGWTVFARYSGHAREEKVDQVQLDEFDPLAERLAGSLLHDRSLSETLTRTTVLRADSETRKRRIRGSTHFQLGLGTAIRYGRLPTAPNTTDPAESRWRLEAPLTVTLGSRNKFRVWALDVFARANLGTSQRAGRRNLGGGHVDYQAGGMLGLHFLRYQDPTGVNSLYYGGGAAFELSRYNLIKPAGANGVQASPDGLWGGGLDLDVLLGYEFMRATSLHFFVEADASLPTYVFHAESDTGQIRSYLPTGLVQVGVLY